MKYIRAILPVLTVVLLATPPVYAQLSSANAVPSINLDPPPAPTPNRFGLSYRMGFNAPVSFKHLGGYPALGGGHIPTLDGDQYNYDNGYVLTDSSGNAQGLTRYWGYDSRESQIIGTSVLMQRSSSAATASSNDHYDNPMSGFELTYNRELIRKKSWRGGLEGAFGYTYMSVHDSGTQYADVTRLNDTYEYGGFPGQPPEAYTGRYDMPGAVVHDSPTSRTTDVLPNAATITGSRDFSANLYGFRFGPYLEIPLSRSIAFTLSGGFALVYVESDLSFNETVTISGVGSVNNEGSGSHSGWLPGGYVAGNISVALSEKWALMAGAQFESVGRYTQNVNGKEATLDLSKAIFVTVGLSYSF